MLIHQSPLSLTHEEGETAALSFVQACDLAPRVRYQINMFDPDRLPIKHFLCPRHIAHSDVTVFGVQGNEEGD